MGHTDNLNTVTVTASRPLIRPDGRYAIELTTREVGTIAFEVNAQALSALRQAISDIETAMKQGIGRA